MRKRFVSMLAIAATAILAACSTAPTVTSDVGSAAGHWVGFATVFGSTWTFDMTLAAQADSLRGTARMTSPAFTFALDYDVVGEQHGDSVSLRMLPVEDATVFVKGLVGSGGLTGRMWFNADTLIKRSIAFARR
jgi:hypothetical protein